MKSPVKAIRKENGWKLLELAENSNTPLSSLWVIEKGCKSDINRTLLLYLHKEGYNVGQLIEDYDKYVKQEKKVS